MNNVHSAIYCQPSIFLSICKIFTFCFVIAIYNFIIDMVNDDVSLTNVSTKHNTRLCVYLLQAKLNL